eukprot:gene3467-8299_t
MSRRLCSGNEYSLPETRANSAEETFDVSSSTVPLDFRNPAVHVLAQSAI